VTLVRSVAFTPASGEYAVGSRVQLPVAVSPASAAGSVLAWSSSDPAVAAVDGSGTVTVLAPGEAVITVRATDGGGAAASFALTAVAADTPSGWAADAVAALAARLVPRRCCMGTGRRSPAGNSRR
jgi:uncharacterized protein YjdB